MTAALGNTTSWSPAGRAGDRLRERDAAIDTMRGLAILMVIAIHSLPKLEGSALVTAIDAAMRPCVPIFLFASGYLTARSGQVPIVKRIMRALGPYTIAFLAAYALMAAQNPLIDNRPAVIVARYALAYVFVYYYVFVYVGCTVMLWLLFTAAGRDRPDRQYRLVALLSLAIVLGLAIGVYLDPVLQRLGVPAPAIEEARMRDVPFWFGFMAVGAILGQLETGSLLQQWRVPLFGATVLGYAGYALVRLFGIGDAADYDSMAFFVYALLFCITLLAFSPHWSALSFLGSTSYAIYLWHIFAIVILREQLASLQRPVAAFLIEYFAALASAVVLVLAVKGLRTPRLARWLGA